MDKFKEIKEKYISSSFWYQRFQLTPEMRDDITFLISEKDKLEKENAKLRKDVELLHCLEAAGVDNWEGYDSAIEVIEE